MLRLFKQLHKIVNNEFKDIYSLHTHVVLQEPTTQKVRQVYIQKLIESAAEVNSWVLKSNSEEQFNSWSPGDPCTNPGRSI